MAKGLARNLARRWVRIDSAGTHPKALHPLIVRVMQGSAIDISRRFS